MNEVGTLDRNARSAPGPRMECRICWYVYDPADGDVVWQVPPHTPFEELPVHWSCPHCSATKDQFLAVADDDERDDDPS